MQDLKHITRKRSFLSTLLRPRRENRRISPPLSSPPAKPQRRVRFVLPILALVLAAYPVAGLFRQTLDRIISPATTHTGKGPEPRPLTPAGAFALAASSLKSHGIEGDRLVASGPSGEKIVYTIDPKLQRELESYLVQNRVPYGLVIVMEPASGKILAMTAHSEIDPLWPEKGFYEVYPMASLFKIITASAALEQKKVSPDTVISFRGSLTSENPRYWAPGKKKNNEMELDLAMGKSVNPVFGRLAADIVGKETLLSYTERFGFNQTLFPETPIPPSRAGSPETPEDLMLMGAGLGRDVKLSPFHAAAIIGSIANGGVMMAPILAERVTTGDGGDLQTAKPRELRRIVSPETARNLSRMLVTTVTHGTSRRAFHDRRGRTLLGPVTVAAKTGSINGTDPPGHYSWFAAYAPVEKPEIALVALVINQQKWKIKASHVGEKALEIFFRE